MRTACILAMLIACAVAGTAAAQERRPLLGRVVDEQGAPVAGAAVTIVENDAPLVGLDPVDVIEAKTDEAGRFVAAALRGVPYSAFAVGPEHDGEALLARPVLGLGCGRDAELKAGMIGKRKLVRVDGLAAFGDIARLRARLVFPACPGYAVELPLGSDGTVDLPPVTTMVNVRIDRVEGGTLGLFDAFGDDASVSLHTFAIAVRAVDAAGAPVAGVRTVATFQHVFDGTPALESPAAMTDADGRATLHVPAWVDPFVEAPQGLFVLGTKDGYAESVSGWTSKVPFVGSKIVDAHDRREIALPMLEAEPLRGRATGVGVAGRRVRVNAMGSATKQKNGMVWDLFVPRSYDVAIGVDGDFAVPEMPRGVSDLRLVLPPIDGRRIALMPSRGPVLAPVDRAELEPLRLQVVDASGGPPSDCKVLLAPFECADRDVELAPAVVLDQAGTAELLVQRGRWQVLARDATGWAWSEIAEWPAPSPLVLRLEELPSMRVRIVGGGGPVVGARFEPCTFGQPQGLPRGRDGALLQLGWNEFADRIRGVSTDADGRAVLHFLPLPGCSPSAFAWRDDWINRSADFPVVAGPDVVEVRLRR